MRNGTVVPSRRAISQRIGRPKAKAPLPSSSQASQLIRFGNESARSTAGVSSASTSSAGRPATFFTWKT